MWMRIICPKQDNTQLNSPVWAHSHPSAFQFLIKTLIFIAPSLAELDSLQAWRVLRNPRRIIWPGRGLLAIHDLHYRNRCTSSVWRHHFRLNSGSAKFEGVSIRWPTSSILSHWNWYSPSWHLRVWFWYRAVYQWPRCWYQLRRQLQWLSSVWQWQSEGKCAVRLQGWSMLWYHCGWIWRSRGKLCSINSLREQEQLQDRYRMWQQHLWLYKWFDWRCPITPILSQWDRQGPGKHLWFQLRRNGLHHRSHSTNTG